MKSEGTQDRFEEIKIKRNQVENRFSEIPAEWTKFSFNLENGPNKSWPLTFYTSGWKGAGFAVYIDDIVIEPR